MTIGGLRQTTVAGHEHFSICAVSTDKLRTHQLWLWSTGGPPPHPNPPHPAFRRYIAPKLMLPHDSTIMASHCCPVPLS
jgi:hypothetical protein